MSEVTRTIRSEDQIGPALWWVGEMCRKGLPAGDVLLVLTRPKRTLPQNDHIHPVCRQIAKHMQAHGAPARSEAWWRYYLLGKWQGQEVLPDPMGDGYIVMAKVGGTSDLTKAQAGEFLEWLYAFGSSIGIDWEQAA